MQSNQNSVSAACSLLLRITHVQKVCCQCHKRPHTFLHMARQIQSTNGRTTANNPSAGAQVSSTADVNTSSHTQPNYKLEDL